MERNGGKVRYQQNVDQMLQKRSTKVAISSCNAEGNWFRGVACEATMESNKERVEFTACAKVPCTVGMTSRTPLLCKTKKLLELLETV